VTRTSSCADGQERLVIPPARIAAERAYRVQLMTQRGRLKQLCAELQNMRSDDSVRLDASKITHLEAAAQRENIEARLDSIDFALSRLREGQFGLCVECGNEIPTERLEARPDASLCVPCCHRGRRPK